MSNSVISSNVVIFLMPFPMNQIFTWELLCTSGPYSENIRQILVPNDVYPDGNSEENESNFFLVTSLKWNSKQN